MLLIIKTKLDLLRKGVKIMEYKSVEYVFNLDKFIDKDDKYHLWIISFAIALQDLTTINKILYNRIKSGESRNMYFQVVYWSFERSF